LGRIKNIHKKYKGANNMRIALDGPSGAGKSTVAKALAKRLGIIYVDTGALYRTVGLYVRNKGVDKDDNPNIISCLDEIKLDMQFIDGEQIITLNGDKIGQEIRTGEIAMYASRVSAIPEVRAFLLETQRKIARENDVVMDGRDIGTVIIPDAEVKIFMVASAEARAKRRYLELQAKGESCTLESVLADIIERDTNDSTRKTAPAIPAADAIHLDNSDLDIEQTVEKVIEIIESKK
jgi:cytidylate kinase